MLAVFLAIGTTEKPSIRTLRIAPAVAFALEGDLWCASSLIDDACEDEEVVAERVQKSLHNQGDIPAFLINSDKMTYGLLAGRPCQIEMANRCRASRQHEAGRHFMKFHLAGSHPPIRATSCPSLEGPVGHEEIRWRARQEAAACPCQQ